CSGPSLPSSPVQAPPISQELYPAHDSQQEIFLSTLNAPVEEVERVAASEDTVSDIQNPTETIASDNIVHECPGLFRENGILRLDLATS
ncbi:hypothetical protein HDU79_001873, partial [Rhizoclosmatium sp. JEL0117]